MTREKFEDIAEKVFEQLPKLFGDKIDNVHIVVEDYPSEEVMHGLHVSKRGLLGLYQGVPLTHRGSWYGTSPTTPDKISLYQANIEAECKNDEEVSERIQEVLLHELGHYFGMNETEIRNAMKNFKPTNY
ncbi:MAG: metallopeptidase family protein [Ignavibacteriae bacterium]|nr:MAG: metallopeptidase family protein [Ignavibacteriota bacterium]